MNAAEMILRRKHESMYKRPRSQQEQAPDTRQDASRHRVRGEQSCASQAGRDVVLTRDGRIVRRTTDDQNRVGTMSDINVNLDL